MAILELPRAAATTPAARQDEVEAEAEAPLQAATAAKGAGAGQVRPGAFVRDVVEVAALAAAAGGRAEAVPAAGAARARLGVGRRAPLPAKAAGAPAVGVAAVVGGAVGARPRRRGAGEAGRLGAPVGPGVPGAFLGAPRAVPVRQAWAAPVIQGPVRVAAVLTTPGPVAKLAPARGVAGVAAVAVMAATGAPPVAGAAAAGRGVEGPVEACALLLLADGAPTGVRAAHPVPPGARAHVPLLGAGAGVAAGAGGERPPAVPVLVGAA